MIDRYDVPGTDGVKNKGVYLKIGNSSRYILEQAKLPKDTIDELTKSSLSNNEVIKAASKKTTLKKIDKDEFYLIYRHGWEVADMTLSANCPDLFSYRNYEMFLNNNK
ncbi:MAG: hypothetical protein WA126_15680 [Thermodesulfovibrionales bacterium]